MQFAFTDWLLVIADQFECERYVLWWRSALTCPCIPGYWRKTYATAVCCGRRRHRGRTRNSQWYNFHIITWRSIRPLSQQWKSGFFPGLFSADWLDWVIHISPEWFLFWLKLFFLSFDCFWPPVKSTHECEQLHNLMDVWEMFFFFWKLVTCISNWAN